MYGMIENYLKRDMQDLLEQRLSESPVVVLEGTRQVGKSTLAKTIEERKNAVYMTLDDINVLNKIINKPLELLADVEHKLVIIDEIQKAPELLNTVKLYVDQQQRNGMFLLTGSTDRYRYLSRFESLTGRSTSLFLHPFSQTEIEGYEQNASFIESLFQEGMQPPSVSCEGLIMRVLRGGYPKVITEQVDRKMWLTDYLIREIFDSLRDSTRSRAVTAIPRVMEVLARQSGRIVNVKDISSRELPSHQIVARLLDLLVNAFVYVPLQSLDLGNKKVAKKEKVYLNDSGLVCALLDLDHDTIKASAYWGHLLETFVLAELRKHLSVSGLPRTANIFYFRQHQPELEVDFVLSDSVIGNLVAIELKAADTIRYSDRVNLVKFKELAQGRCKRAIILYTGSEVQKFPDGVEAWPLSCLWQWPWPNVQSQLV